MTEKSGRVLPFSANDFGLKYDTDFFIYSAKNKTFYAEASNLGLAPNVVPEYFWIHNPKSGRTAIFDLMEIEQDIEGNDACYRYVCEDYGASAIVWND